MSIAIPATIWALTNKDQLQLKITEYDWANSQQLFDFGVVLSINDNTGIGRGTDKEQSLALEKAISEAVERSMHTSHMKSEHLLRRPIEGVAVHPNPKLAILNAEYELKERSSFYTSYLGNSPIEPVDSTQLSLENRTLLETVEAYGSFSIYEILTSDHEPKTVVITGQSHFKRRFLTTALKADLNQSVYHAVIELLRSVHFHSLQIKSELSFSEVKKLQMENQPAIDQEISLWLQSNAHPEPPNNMNDALTQNILTQSYSLKDLYGCPLTLARSRIRNSSSQIEIIGTMVEGLGKSRCNPLI